MVFSLQGKDASKLTDNWFQRPMLIFTKEYLPTSVFGFLVPIFRLFVAVSGTPFNTCLYDLLTPTGVSCLTNKIEGFIGLIQFCISDPAVGMFCINTHACRELTCWLHMNRPNLHNAKLLLTVAVKQQNVWSFPVVTRCYEQRTSKKTESRLVIRIPFLLARCGAFLIGV